MWAILEFRVYIMPTPSRHWTCISLAQKCKSMCAEKKYRIYPLRVKIKREMSDDEWARYLVEGLPNTSAVLADRLLKELETPLGVFNATPERIKEIEGFGQKKSERIAQILRHKYKSMAEKCEKKEDETKTPDQPA
jgi:ERCC4-type nuclease